MFWRLVTLRVLGRSIGVSKNELAHNPGLRWKRILIGARGIAEAKPKSTAETNPGLGAAHECTICNKQFESHERLRSHLWSQLKSTEKGTARVHHTAVEVMAVKQQRKSVAPFKCICGKRFTTRENLIEHLSGRKKIGYDEYHPIDDCKAFLTAFKKNKRLKKLAATHTCLCGRRFSRRALKTHLLYSLNNKPNFKHPRAASEYLLKSISLKQSGHPKAPGHHKCPWCSEKYARGALRKHLSYAIASESDDNPLHPKTDAQELRDHLKREIGTTIRGNFICKSCEKTFVSRTHLRLHLNGRLARTLVDPTHPREVCEKLLAELIDDKTEGRENGAFCPKGFDTRRKLRKHYCHFIVKKDSATHPRAGCERLWNDMRERGGLRPRRKLESQVI